MSGEVHHISQGGISGTHDLIATEDIVLAPTTEQELNTLKLPLIPIACWGLYDPPFEFDSSFIGPLAQQEMGFLADLREQKKQRIDGKTLYPPLSIFGHADPSGPPDPVASDAYNKQLSGRRAMAVYALLTRDLDLWEFLFSSHQQCGGGDTWGLRSIQTMLKALPQRPPSEPPREQWPYDPGPSDGVMGPRTQEALQKFQHDEGLPQSGNPDKPTRRKLFKVYMEFLCVNLEGKPYRLEKTDFLARGADKEGKGDYQGCSRFNPVLLFSQQENLQYQAAEDKGARNADNEPNRRVVAYLFRPGAKIEPSKWPCPHAKEGPSGCYQRFWSDAAQRRSCQPKRREYEQDKDTFACRFYDRLASLSPCEHINPILKIRLYDTYGERIPNAPYRVILDGEIWQEGIASDGFFELPLETIPGPDRCIVEWSDPSIAQASPGSPASSYKLDVFLNVDVGDADEQAKRRLNNLGYVIEQPYDDNLAAFQHDFKLPMTRTLDPQTKAKLFKVHQSCPQNLES